MAMPTTNGYVMTDRPAAGEGWDTIAKRAYGKEMYMGLLLAENPKLCDRILFNGTEEVQVPVLESSSAASVLPEWLKE